MSRFPASRQLTSLFHSAAMEEATLRMHHHQVPCRLAAHDPEERECEGNLEAYHWIGRQRVRNYLLGLLPTACRCLPCEGTGALEAEYKETICTVMCGSCSGTGSITVYRDELITLAEWDPRNAGPGCEMHHRRLDLHRMPPLKVSYQSLPDHVIEYAADWGLGTCLHEKYAKEKA